jgi:hypothetical protein
MSTVVVQATAFPVSALRQVSWLEVSLYGYDEVDMAHKLQKLGWTFAFAPEVSLAHHQSDIGRAEYARPTQIARLYFRLRSFSVYDRRPAALIAYLIVAPLHLLAAQLRVSNWSGAREVPGITYSAISSWLGSLRRDWRRC